MREYINFFYDLASDAAGSGKYEYAFAMENTGSMINNLAHGISKSVWLPKVHRGVSANLENSDSSVEMKQGWADALDFLEAEIKLLQNS